MEEHLLENLEEATPVLRGFVGDAAPVCGIVLGSGLNAFADDLEDARALPFGDVPHMKHSTAVSHVGRFVCGRVPESDAWVLAMQGRLHGYEGNTAAEVAFPIWLMGRCGVDTLIATNAAGAINPAFNVGDFCIMTDHINLTGRNPLAGVQPDQMAPRFVNMLSAYDPHLRALAHAVADAEDVNVCDGVYLGLLGPSFETPAEIRAFAALGADTVAMSVVEEVIAARHVGMRVLGMSFISNMACGVGGADPMEEDLEDVAVRSREAFRLLMCGIVRGIANGEELAAASVRA